MRPALRSFSSLLLAALLLAWVTLCGAGVVAWHHGEGAAHCHQQAAGHLDDHHHGADQVCDGMAHESHTELTQSPSCRDRQCGCIPQHHHSAITSEMLLFQALNAPSPVWAEVFACPFPVRLFNEIPIATARLETGPEHRISGPPPPHLACGPMLI